MKTLINWLIVGAFICITAGCVYLYILYEKANNHKNKSPIEEAAKKQVETKADIIAKSVDANGLGHTIAKMAKEIDPNELDKLNADLLDTVAALNIARDKLIQVTVVAANLQVRNQQLERKVTELATTYTHSDDHFRLSVNVPKDSMQSATFNAGYDADLITTQYNKGNWLTGNRFYMDIYSNDPRFTIKGARTLTVKQKQPFFRADLQAISEYNFRTKSFAAGPSINIGLGRVEVRGRYMYDPSENQWNGVVSGGYMLLKK